MNPFRLPAPTMPSTRPDLEAARLPEPPPLPPRPVPPRATRDEASSRRPRQLAPATASQEQADLQAAIAQSRFEHDLRTAIDASRSAMRPSIPQPTSRSEAEAHWRQAMRESREHHELKTAIDASLATPSPADRETLDLIHALTLSRAEGDRAESLRPKTAADAPLHLRLVKGRARGDGNCFFHSLRQFRAPEIEAVFGRPMAQISHVDLRRQVARHAIRQMNACLRPGPQASALKSRFPHLEHLLSAEAEGPPPDDASLARVLGEDEARRCAHMTPSQRTHVFNLACADSWRHGTGDLFPQATTAAFPGLRLVVVTDSTTPRNLAEHTFGHGTSRPRFLYLDQAPFGGGHYVPARPRRHDS